ncbi:MAG: ATP-binding protein [Chloroflexota bacterium]|nr:ATP-binding protein [Dehalococcoidia bacterium]MDW8253042.1 ATP-binding protein [Chloroflexota bacterium]
MMRRLTQWTPRLSVQLLVLGALAALVGTILSLLFVIAERRESEAAAERSFLQLARALAGRGEQQIASLADLLATLALFPEIRTPVSPACSAILAQVLREVPGFTALEIAAPDGQVVCRDRPESGSASVGDQPWFRESVTTGRFTVGGITVGAPPFLPLAVPMRDDAGTVVGVLVARIDVALIAQLTAGLDLPPNTALTVLDEKGQVVYRFPDAAQYVGRPTGETELGRAVQSSAESTFVAPGLDGVRRMYALAPLHPAGTLLLGVPLEIIYEPVTTAFRRNLLVLLGALLTTLAGLWVAVNIVVERPLRRLISTTRRLAAGDYAVRTGLENVPSEVGELARAFDRLADQLAQRDRQLQAQMAELRRSNADLEQFASAISHDLQAPLRSIAGFSQLLARRYRGRIDPDADEFLQYIIGAVDRLNALIVDLLTYSRLAIGPRTLQATDTRRAVAHAVANLRGQIEASGAQVRLGNLPTVRADLSQLTQVFQNLIANSIKYRSTAPPVIAIDAEREDGSWVFRVSDNGIGIAPEHAERVFRIFQRLHPPDVYDGTGIGLAICKTVIERHGGHIWIEPAPSGGTVVAFRLPAELEENNRDERHRAC